MLILSRKLDETIRIGDDIEIMVVRIAGDAVRLGIEAPRSMPIVRAEKLEQRPQPAEAACGEQGEDE